MMFGCGYSETIYEYYYRRPICWRMTLSENRCTLFRIMRYSTGLPNLFDFGRPSAIRPASARLPFQLASSFMDLLWSRPAPSFQVRPSLESKVVTSDSLAEVYFCRRTQRPRAISGTWSRPNTTIL